MASSDVLAPISFAVSVTSSAQRVVASRTSTNSLTEQCIIQANPANSGNIFVGGADVDTLNGIILEPGTTFNLGQLLDKKRSGVIDLYNTWIVSSTGQNARIIISKEVQV
jgi:hypothetical protein